MFWNIQKINELEFKLEQSLEDNRKLTEFYEETKQAEIERLTTLVDTLTESNSKMTDAKEAARKDLEKEYNDKLNTVRLDYESKLKTIEENYSAKLVLEAETNSAKRKSVEDQVTTEVNNRVNEAVAQIKLDIKESNMENKHNKELMEIYKKKFEWGKIELWADEIKWMLLSANPNGQKILETMSSVI